jgi:heme exporter protein A
MMRNETTRTAEREIPRRPALPAIEVSGIARRFGERWALRGVSLRVEAGETVALLGRNGSGKTTLLRILSTLLRPTRGTGRIFGYDLIAEAVHIRGDLGVLGHSPGLYGDLTAAENLRFALRMYGQAADPEIIHEALEAVSLGREADRHVRGFSAGMQRRLALARLMLRRPRLVLLDEPYASFDASGIDLVNGYLSEHRANGGAAVVATHDLARGRGVLDRVVELESGRALVPEGVG